MAISIIKKPIVQQIYPNLNYSHPFLANLELGLVASRAGTIKAAVKPPYNWSTKTSVQSGTISGVGEKFSGSSGYVTSTTVAGTAPWTIIFYGLITASGQSAIAGTAEFAGAGTHDRSLYINTSNKLASYIFDGSAKEPATSGSVPVGTPFMGAAVATGSQIITWLNSEKASLAASNTGFNSYATPTFVIGYGDAGSSVQNASSNAIAYYVLKLNRAIRDSEWLSLIQNPWQIFLQTYSYVPASAVTPPVTTIYEFQSFSRGVGRGIARGIA